MALGVERLVAAIARGMLAGLACDPSTRGERTLIVRIDVLDVHTDVLARGAGALRAARAVSALCADPDHAVAVFDHRMADHSLRADAPRGRDLAEPECALQERERSVDVLIRKLGNDRRPSRGLDLSPDRRHEHFLSPVERRRVDRGVHAREQQARVERRGARARLRRLETRRHPRARAQPPGLAAPVLQQQIRADPVQPRERARARCVERPAPLERDPEQLADQSLRDFGARPPAQEAQQAGRVAVVDQPEGLGLAQRAADHLRVRGRAHLLPFPDRGHRYFRLASPTVGDMIDGIVAVALQKRPRYRPLSREARALSAARICYDHLAGRLSVDLTDAFVARKYVVLDAAAAEITAAGTRFFTEFGIELPAPRSTLRHLCRLCLDWTERRPHIAGTVGPRSPSATSTSAGWKG